MSASQNKKKTLSLGLALIPVISMLLLLIIGYGIMGLRIEPLLLCSAAVAAGIAWWQGYCWEDIINSVVDKLAKAMPVIMILICVGGLIGTWMFSGTIPYMVYWGLKLISPEYILIAAFFLTSVVSVCTGTSWGSAGTVGVALMGVAAGLDVSLAAAAGAVVSGAYFGDKISPLSDSTNFAAIVADTTLFEHIQHLLWTTLPSFLLAAVVYLIAGHSNMLGEVATPQRVTDIIHSLESLYHFNIVLILPPVIVLWGAIRKKPVIPLMLSACVLALFLGVIMQGLSIKQGLDAFIDGFDIAMFPQGAEGVVADVPRLLNRGGMFSMMGTILLVFCAFSFAGALTLTGALTIIINRLLTIIHSVGQLIAATIGTTILVTGATSDGKLALLVPAELFKDAYRRMGLDTKNLSRTIEDAGTVIEPLLPWTSAGVYMATTLGVSTLDLLPWAIQCYAAIFFALIYGFSGIGIARTASASEKSPLLCEAYDVTLISDEIWADLLLPGETFTSVLHLGERWHKRVISATAASKTFGLSSLRISNFLIPDPTLRQRFLSRLDAHGLDVFNALSVQAATTAWNESRQWLDSLLDYLAENRRWFVEQATEHLPWARIVPAQGTYLLWMDCKKLGLDDEQLKWVMADVAGIAPSMGSGFGPAGSGFIRLNLGCPRTYLEMAIDGLKRISVKTIKGIPTGG